MFHNANPRHPAHPPRGTRRAVTLVELVLALTIVAIVSTAVAVMLAGAGKTHQYVNTGTDTMARVEHAYRRMMHNIRTSSSMSNPTDATLHTPGTLTVVTQPDTGYAGGATVTYSVSNGNLVENDQRYGTNTLLTNVSSFSVQRISTSPTQLSITITSGTTPAVTRTAVVTCRNY